MAAKIPPSVLPDISPTRGEINCCTNLSPRSASPTIEMEREACSLSISPLVGEISGRTEGGKRLALRGQTHAR
ncbi:hypothetical protein DXM27_14150 [Rhizobium rhizogenes]|uniref:Propionyl-coenzyme A carboxylase alpha polypeptide n=1 Tax=Rhizobium rhizogenes TaxID=359 RepID=A0AA88F0Q9_RHIRH|nr:hypothetical protein DXM27_14150 [Rhizobium rhizogenes]